MFEHNQQKLIREQDEEDRARELNWEEQRLQGALGPVRVRTHHFFFVIQSFLIFNFVFENILFDPVTHDRAQDDDEDQTETRFEPHESIDFAVENHPFDIFETPNNDNMIDYRAGHDQSVFNQDNRAAVHSYC